MKKIMVGVIIIKFHSHLLTPDFYGGGGATAPSGPGPPHSRGFYITHDDAPQSVKLLWTSY